MAESQPVIVNFKGFDICRSSLSDSEELIWRNRCWTETSFLVENTILLSSEVFFFYIWEHDRKRLSSWNQSRHQPQFRTAVVLTMSGSNQEASGRNIKYETTMSEKIHGDYCNALGSSVEHRLQQRQQTVLETGVIASEILKISVFVSTCAGKTDWNIMFTFWETWWLQWKTEERSCKKITGTVRMRSPQP